MVLDRCLSVRRWRALVKPGPPATAFGAKGLTRASAPAPVPPCVRRRGGLDRPFPSRSSPKSTDTIRHIGKTMVPVGLPEPVGRGQREATKPRFALGELQGPLLKPAELHGKGSEEDGKPDNRAQGANRDDERLAAPWGESHFF